ncbi:hypothetical protein [Rhodococcoides corynebacterioides]|nr:hypothetical protein [Rhodococcus corynebacterioides]
MAKRTTTVRDPRKPRPLEAALLGVSGVVLAGLLALCAAKGLL